MIFLKKIVDLKNNQRNIAGFGMKYDEFKNIRREAKKVELLKFFEISGFKKEN